MPGQNPSPIPAIMAELDVRALSGVTLFSRPFGGTGTVNVVAPTFAPTTPNTTGIYEDWLDFLHGYGSESVNTLQADLTAEWGARGGALTISLTSADKVKISSSLNQITILSSPTFGIPTATTITAGIPYEFTAPDNWVRGLVENQSITISSGTAIISIPSLAYKSQSVPTMFRSRGVTGDADDNQDNTTTLEGIDNTAAPSRDIRWFVTDDGKVGWAAANSITGGSGITSLNSTFREMIGWSGNEAVTTSGGVDSQVGDYYATRCLVPTRPLERLTRDRLVEDEARRLRDGGIASAVMGTYDRVFIEGWIDGPNDSRDLHRHWLENVAPYLTRGRRCTVYFEWGDPRRGLGSWKVTDTQDAYDLLYSTEKDGERARYRGRMDVSAAGFNVDWPGRNRRRAPMSLNLSKAED